MKVILVIDDFDRHGSGCTCGLCNSNGKAYGCAIFNAVDKDRVDPVCRVYGPSEDSVLHNAKILCRCKGWKVVMASAVRK